MPARALADPEAKRTSRVVAQLLDDEAGSGCAIHKHADRGPFYDKADMEPFIAVGFWDDGLFVLIRALGAQRLPGPAGVGGVLHGMAVPGRVGGAKIERPEV